VNNKRLYFSIVVSIISVLLFIITLLVGIHGGINNIAVLLFITPIIFVWLLGFIEMKPIYFYSLPVIGFYK
jgi:hypothetical protein